jgi:hypothetical protein
VVVVIVSVCAKTTGAAIEHAIPTRRLFSFMIRWC